MDNPRTVGDLLDIDQDTYEYLTDIGYTDSELLSDLPEEHYTSPESFVDDDLYKLRSAIHENNLETVQEILSGVQLESLTTDVIEPCDLIREAVFSGNDSVAKLLIDSYEGVCPSIINTIIDTNNYDLYVYLLGRYPFREVDRIPSKPQGFNTDLYLISLNELFKSEELDVTNLNVLLNLIKNENNRLLLDKTFRIISGNITPQNRTILIEKLKEIKETLKEIYHQDVKSVMYDKLGSKGVYLTKTITNKIVSDLKIPS